LSYLLKILKLCARLKRDLCWFCSPFGSRFNTTESSKRVTNLKTCLHLKVELARVYYIDTLRPRYESLGNAVYPKAYLPS